MGNTILVNIAKSNKNYEYVYIGESVYEFKTDEELTDYFSMIDRNDVPAPLCIRK